RCHVRPAVVDRGDPGLNGPAIPDGERETRPCTDLFCVAKTAFPHSLGQFRTDIILIMLGMVDLRKCAQSPFGCTKMGVSCDSSKEVEHHGKSSYQYGRRSKWLWQVCSSPGSWGCYHPRRVHNRAEPWSPASSRDHERGPGDHYSSGCVRRSSHSCRKRILTL